MKDFEYLRDFFLTNQEVARDTLLSETQVKHAKKALRKLGFVKVCRKGSPPRSWYTFDWDKYEEVVKRVFGLDGRARV